jgi:integrase
MPKTRITTQAEVDAIPYSTDGRQVIWWNTELDHFGIRAGAREKTFVVGHRVNKQWKLVTLGRAGEITVQKAIRDAKIILGEMVGGIDPTARERAQTAGGMTLRQAWQLYQQALKKLNRSPATLRDYQLKIDCHMSDWLDRPLVEITRDVANKRHTSIGENHGRYMANGCMRTLRAIWRRTRRQHPEMPEPPTLNIDFYPETGRTAIITDWPAWWSGIQQVINPVRRDFYIWLAFSGCRTGETMTMQVKHVDLENGVVKYPVTKTDAFEMPISKFMIELLRNRIAENGADCRWVFPSGTAASGHLGEAKLIRSEAPLFKEKWSPHTLRHSWISLADQKVGISDSHQRALTNHAPKRGDAHAGYIHPDLDDLRTSQQAMTDYLLAQISPKPGKGKKSGDNVVQFKQQVV